jgi:CspA family cold shock protein
LSAPSARAAAERLFAPTAEREPVRGRIKWFDPIKGFGFVSVPEGGKDVFIHSGVLIGTEWEPRDLLPGATVEFTVSAESRGPQVAHILDLDIITASSARAPLVPIATGSGSVSRWREDRGFGFLDLDGGGGCYFNSNCLALSGLDDDVAIGDRFEVDIADGERGPMAVHLRRI